MADEDMLQKGLSTRTGATSPRITTTAIFGRNHKCTQHLSSISQKLRTRTSHTTHLHVLSFADIVGTHGMSDTAPSVRVRGAVDLVELASTSTIIIISQVFLRS